MFPYADKPIAINETTQPPLAGVIGEGSISENNRTRTNNSQNQVSYHSNADQEKAIKSTTKLEESDAEDDISMNDHDSSISPLSDGEQTRKKMQERRLLNQQLNRFGGEFRSPRQKSCSESHTMTHSQYFRDVHMNNPPGFGKDCGFDIWLISMGPNGIPK